jgi:hypothetical protein
MLRSSGHINLIWLGQPTCRWENNIKMDLKEIGLERVGWINLTE